VKDPTKLELTNHLSSFVIIMFQRRLFARLCALIIQTVQGQAQFPDNSRFVPASLPVDRLK